MGYEIADIVMADNVDIEKIPDAVPRDVFKKNNFTNRCYTNFHYI